MALLAKFTWREQEGTLPNRLAWCMGSSGENLRHIVEHGHSCWEIYANGDELSQILANSKNIPNLTHHDEQMYFVGDWAKMIACNLAFLFPE